jgi:hypothetical protein
MPDEMSGSSSPRRGAGVVHFFRVVTALIIAPVAFAVIVVAVLTLVVWVVVGASLWLVGAAGAIARPDGGRRLRSAGAKLLRSGPSRWLVKAAVHRVRRAFSALRRRHEA